MTIKNENNMETRKSGIDLHLHTDNSDGLEPLEVVVEKARKAGLSVIAITDHNKFTINECRQIDGLLVVPGVEFSTKYEAAFKDYAVEIHIVGIFPNGVNKSDFDDIFKEIACGKAAYVEAILKDLETREIYITLEEVYRVKRPCEHVGRHQIAQVLVDKKIEKDIDAAFDHQIGDHSPYYIPSTKFINYAPLDVVVRKIRECGGIPCLAHPYGYKFKEEEIEILIKEFKLAAGEVAGLEVFYESYLMDPERMGFLKKMQEKYHLLASCGSDRHREDQPFATGGNVKLFEKMLSELEKGNTV